MRRTVRGGVLVHNASVSFANPRGFPRDRPESHHGLAKYVRKRPLHRPVLEGHIGQSASSSVRCNAIAGLPRDSQSTGAGIGGGVDIARKFTSARVVGFAIAISPGLQAVKLLAATWPDKHRPEHRHHHVK